MAVSIVLEPIEHPSFVACALCVHRSVASYAAQYPLFRMLENIGRVYDAPVIGDPSLTVEVVLEANRAARLIYAFKQRMWRDDPASHFVLSHLPVAHTGALQSRADATDEVQFTR